ncbi:30S ribosomal protein S4 [Candidatus Roizmanbacteria bacterium RIFCSPLOWO2_01_FULL_42_14]|uniref:Small ribosomal subunit protein uS4 n=4 Tax=Candidatus Roizmaniibacteriota TaxID=1752723 RepID=A0A1F7JV03_9BACT|nr:MAG: 30S ribosomal protein S4 [Candidatus Roizmanbacteria bacterium RIFCSPHIGHO2_02_FULL_43_11]OGK38617.1 MAG: 30S ribosomal protein S4 [Candidatus Roizmanbacteria bacterium RIFCSPHIGHO2_12_FULL_42_10]OGK52211.1 MAG: 30S ribosomal protein S4 [Candidatus Roizmanbacteria bacterium RIFCSPLOWO2_01_FULL_42_14]OGK59444.1 MAG: 30S ribosomal protein S4 [Candidatus Roizmanbacteria bacterium RIFCSPLOWO2_02_FULL_43_10]
MRYTGPRNKLARREGIDLGLRGIGTKAHASLLRRMNIRPGQKPNTRYPKVTEYGLQLRDKQKIRRMYGLTESQLHKYFEEASRTLGNTSTLLIQLLESRLDNVVYKLGFTPTRAAARQLVNHGHFLVNNNKSTIPSMQIKVGDIISFKKGATTQIPYVKEMIDRKDITPPDWLQRKATLGKVINKPGIDMLVEEINLQAVIEFYSR